MDYVEIPTDLSHVKTKVLGSLTKRQLICFSLAAICGLPVFFLTKNYISLNNAVLLMMVSMFPFFMFGMYERNGQPLEVILKHYITAKFIRPQKRPYITKNFYAYSNKEKTKPKQEVNTFVRSKKTTIQKQKR